MDVLTPPPRISLDDVIAMLEIYRQTAVVTLASTPDNATARQLSVLTENALLYLETYRRSIPSFEYIKEAFIRSKLEKMSPAGRAQ